MISEEIKSQALAVLELCLSEALVSQSVEKKLNTEFFKFHNYLMEGFRIDLKTFWAWLSLTNAPKVSESKYQAGFEVIISDQNHQTFMIRIYSTSVLYDNLL